jgi:hypothetical protein
MGFDWQGTLGQLAGRLKEVKDKMLGDEEAQQPELLEGHVATVQQIVTDLWEAFQDGFDLSDLGAVAKAVVKFVEIAEDMEDKTGPEKKQFVQDAALAVYRIWDPNIPIIWGDMERALERKAVHLAAGAVVDGCLSLVRKLKAKDEDGVNEKAPPPSDQVPPDPAGSR